MPTLLAANNYYYRRGGSEAVFFWHNDSLAEIGWRVVPFSMHHPNNAPSEWSRYFVSNNELGSSRSPARKLAMLPSVIYSFEARRRLLQILSRVRPDVCHAHNIYHHLSPSILSLLAQRNIPTVMTLHDLKIACPAYTMLTHDGVCERCRSGRLYNVVAHRCIKDSLPMSAIALAEAVVHRLLGSYSKYVNRFVVPSRFHVQKFCEWGMPASKFVHIPNFVDADAYVPDFTPGSDFLYFGRLSAEKGLATLIRAAARSKCSVRIVGTGPDLDGLRNLAATTGADVTFPGYLVDGALHSAVRSARAVVLPSEWYENAPVSILEAYALGKPVAGARIGGITELIREFETGVTFVSGSVDALAETLLKLRSMADRDIERMGRSARNWVQQEFRRDLYRQRMLDLYADLGVHPA